uniref:(northern house mosquito) hypothetical protein n=1 Tax=Culex pipiens TaxID=7175 RepID=A0A8D8LF79_CULPI
MVVVAVDSGPRRDPSLAPIRRTAVCPGSHPTNRTQTTRTRSDGLITTTTTEEVPLVNSSSCSCSRTRSTIRAVPSRLCRRLRRPPSRRKRLNCTRTAAARSSRQGPLQRPPPQLWRPAKCPSFATSAGRAL